ncbi:MAG: P-loop NTPase [Candidatus Binataceae bacterium]
MKFFTDSLTESAAMPGLAPELAAARDRIAIAAPKAVIAFASSKGGTGKSALAVNVAVSLALAGRKIGIVDADLNAPSVPGMLGVKPFRMIPMVGGIQPTAGPLGLRLIAANLIPEGEPAPFSFAEEPEIPSSRPVELGYSLTFSRIFSQIRFGPIDLVLVDLAPGLDHLHRACRMLALSGIVMVTHPSEGTQSVNRAAIELAAHSTAPILGIIENMIGFNCDNCHSVRPLFPRGAQFSGSEVRLLGRLPFDPRLAECADRGQPFVKRYADAPLARQINELARVIERSALALSSGANNPNHS